MRIAQLSDIHVLDPRFEERLLDAAIEEVNAEAPDLVVVAGDLTAGGYREEFEYARERLDRLEAEEVVYVPGNHDARSVGYLHFEDLFGARVHSRTFDAPEGEVQVVWWTPRSPTSTTARSVASCTGGSSTPSPATPRFASS